MMENKEKISDGEVIVSEDGHGEPWEIPSTPTTTNSATKETKLTFKKESKKEAKKYKQLKKDKNDPQRFFGEGVNFKAKLIGLKDVPTARGEKMAQDVLQELKIQKKNSGVHKQKIVINISLEGLKLKDDKSGETLHMHPVHKISFISQDANDGRAFGYIYGCPENRHTFYAIKTEKAAQQVVMCMKDLFQIAFELKKKEFENMRKANGKENADNSMSSESSDNNKSQESHNTSIDSKSEVNKSGDSEILLLDLESDQNDNNDQLKDPFFSDPWGYMNNANGAITITEPDPFVVSQGQGFMTPNLTFPEPNESSNSNNSLFPPRRDLHLTIPQPTTPTADDPFNTSFVTMTSSPSTSTPFLPPPPAPAPQPPPQQQQQQQQHHVPPPTDRVAPPPPPLSQPAPQAPTPPASTISEDKYAALANISIVRNELSSGSSTTSSNPEDSGLNTAFANWTATFDSQSDEFNFGGGGGVGVSGQVPQPPAIPPRPFSSSPSFAMVADPSSAVFSELDPLGKDRPYIDKKDFFHDVKNPPKKVLRDLMTGIHYSGDLNNYVPPEPPSSPAHSSDSFIGEFGYPVPDAPSPTNMASSEGSSMSTSSSSSSTSSSPPPSIMLGPPHPPARPGLQFPTLPPPLPPKRTTGHSLFLGQTGEQWTMTSPPVATTPDNSSWSEPVFHHNNSPKPVTSPPIPIPARRPRGRSTSESMMTSSSTGFSSSDTNNNNDNNSHHNNSYNNNNDNNVTNNNNNKNAGHHAKITNDFLPTSPPAVATTTTTTTPSRGDFNVLEQQAAPLQWPVVNNRNISNNMRNNQVIISPPPPTQKLRRPRAGVAEGEGFGDGVVASSPPTSGTTMMATPNATGRWASDIFQKKDDPFADDFFAVASVTTPVVTSQWNSNPFHN